MSNLGKLAIEHGDLLASTGYALKTLADLLGVDGSEHNLTQHDTNGLTHAVRALAGYVSAAGLALYDAAEMAGALEAKQ
jgi:hypothetical protein